MDFAVSAVTVLDTGCVSNLVHCQCRQPNVREHVREDLCTHHVRTPAHVSVKSCHVASMRPSKATIYSSPSCAWCSWYRAPPFASPACKEGSGSPSQPSWAVICQTCRLKYVGQPDKRPPPRWHVSSYLKKAAIVAYSAVSVLDWILQRERTSRAHRDRQLDQASTTLLPQNLRPEC